MTRQQRILVVEDDAAIRRGIVDALRFEGFHAVEAADGKAGMALALEVDCALVLLDLVLPGKHGLEILQAIRQDRPTLPVIILTALGEEADRVRGLRMGADDYVVKPFSVSELLARVQAVLRRSPQRPTDVLTAAVPGGQIDFSRSEIRFQDGRREDLSEREAELLRYLVVNSGRVISRDELLRSVWRIEPRGLWTRTIDMHIARLREKLGDDASDPKLILTVRGKGYMYGTTENAS
ncbi:MAG TPA: response regulator transcription factor [Candidatus Anammoximicrobium sp.]|nr:response regulator transcription factor [Candidatus Anammoximicrobium sp.]